MRISRVVVFVQCTKSPVPSKKSSTEQEAEKMDTTQENAVTGEFSKEHCEIPEYVYPTDYDGNDDVLSY